eukprot:COSAG02_NODE_1608_length_11711_cov_5.975026_6_plen_51_part_00
MPSINRFRDVLVDDLGTDGQRIGRRAFVQAMAITRSATDRLWATCPRTYM